MPVWIEAVQDEMLARTVYGRFGDINAGDVRFAASQCCVDGKCAGVAETVQYVLRAGILAQRFAFIALVKKKARFLPLPGINQKEHIIFAYRDPRGNAARNNARLLYLQTLTAARLAIIA